MSETDVEVSEVVMINAADAILDGTYDPSKWEEYFFDAGESFDQSLPEGFSCGGYFHCGSKFNQLLPEGFTCGRDFYCGESFNQPLPEGFKCAGIFHCGESFNQPLPEVFKCGGSFSCGSKFNQLLPTGFKCNGFYCGASFDQPLPIGFECEGHFDCGLSFNQPLPVGFTCGIFQRGDKFKCQYPPNQLNDDQTVNETPHICIPDDDSSQGESDLDKLSYKLEWIREKFEEINDLISTVSSTNNPNLFNTLPSKPPESSDILRCMIYDNKQVCLKNLLDAQEMLTISAKNITKEFLEY